MKTTTQDWSKRLLVAMLGKAMIIAVLAFGMAVVGCDSDSSSGDNSGGTSSGTDGGGGGGGGGTSEEKSPFEGSWKYIKNGDESRPFIFTFTKDTFSETRGGENYVRGTFTYTETKIKTTVTDEWDGNKWVASLMTDEWDYSIVGDTLILAGDEWKKVK